ncbi:MAG: hypothetical protein R2749_25740 [Acidimicrobiales bacterium]
MIGPDDVTALLGRIRFRDEVADRTSVARGGHRAGGDRRRRRDPVHRGGGDGRRARPHLTGQLGDVMRESAEIARSTSGPIVSRWASTAASTPPGSTCTCPPAPHPGTGPPPTSP